VNPVAVGWFAGGIVLAAPFASSAIYEGWFTGLVGGGDISLFVGFLVPLVGYFLTMRARARRAATVAA
jgi:hypothetical protein